MQGIKTMPMFDTKYYCAGQAVYVESRYVNGLVHGANGIIVESDPLVLKVCYVKTDGTVEIASIRIDQVLNGDAGLVLLKSEEAWENDNNIREQVKQLEDALGGRISPFFMS